MRCREIQSRLLARYIAITVKETSGFYMMNMYIHVAYERD